MYSDPDKRRSNQRRWDRHRRDRDRAAAAAAWRAWRSHQDPNIRRERESEQRFRWRTPAPHWPLSITTRLEHQRPTFFFIDASGVLQQERWETPDELVARLEKKGALIVKKRPEIPRQPQELDAEAAREILRGSALDHGEEADKHDTEIEIAVQMLLLHSHKSADDPELEPIVARLSALQDERHDLLHKLQQIAEREFQKYGYQYVLDQK